MRRAALLPVFHLTALATLLATASIPVAAGQATLNIVLVLGILGYFGIQTTAQCQ